MYEPTKISIYLFSNIITFYLANNIFFNEKNKKYNSRKRRKQ